VDRKKIVEDLVNTFNDRDELHEAYKEKMKEIIAYAFLEFADFADSNPNASGEDVEIWIGCFVEEHFKHG
jgi:hypothetical protein